MFLNGRLQTDNIMETTNYKRPLLDVVAFSPEGGFAQSGVMTIQKWVYDDSQSDQLKF